MATEVVKTGNTTNDVEPGWFSFSAAPSQVSWGAIFAGTLAALAVWCLLYTLGLALGLSAIDPDDVSSARTSGIFTGVWGVASPLIAFFVGGWVAGRASPAVRKSTGALHGFLMWAFCTLAGAWLLINLLSTLVSGAASVGRTAAQVGGNAISSAIGRADADSATRVAQRFGIDANDALAPVNRRLRAEGKPPVRADQIEAATRDLIQDAVRRGELDRSMIVQSLADNTALSRADAEDVANRIELQFNAFRDRAGRRIDATAERVRTGALEAAEDTGKAFWGIFLALLLGMLSAIAGSIAAIARRDKALATSPGTVDGVSVRRGRANQAPTRQYYS